MMKKRIIPCLDIKEGRTVKGVNFVNMRDAGDPVELAINYQNEGADELVFLDIAATLENRKTMTDLVTKIAEVISIPFTVGGGISTVDDAERVLSAGANKVSINSAAVSNPSLITDIANKFGKKSIVLAIDTKLDNGVWYVYTRGGNTPTPLRAIEWAKEGERLGAGEILLTSMSNDGTKDGFAIDITAQISEAVSIPVIASGGAGSIEHFEQLFLNSKVNAALAASVFHFGEISIPELKSYLKSKNINI
ncbi:MAG: imidazole glycerol phosphate synthase subunit HisF [Proteiniphilum sp.]|nr:imidazole glycerol phosphate synthase subunit HisF [Proteiniphilum sp.]